MKHQRHIFLFLAILIFGGGVYIYTSASSLLARHLSPTLGTPTTLNPLLFHPPLISLHNLKVKNPPGYTLPFALIIQNLSVKAPYLNYFQRSIHIDEITLQDVHLDIEFLDEARTKGNWISLINHAKINHTALIPRNSVINKLTINNLSISIYLNDEEPRQIRPIPNITFSNIKTNNGRFIEELTELVVKKMINEVLLKEEVQSVIGLPFSVFDMF